MYVVHSIFKTSAFHKQAVFHMSILPLCMFMVLPAAILAMSCQKARVVKERAGHMLVTIIFLLYPGIECIF